MFALIPHIPMAERIESHESEPEASSVKNFQVQGEEGTGQLNEKTGIMRKEGGARVVAEDVDGKQMNREVFAASVENDVVTEEVGNLEGGLTEVRIRNLVAQNKVVQRNNSVLVVRGVSAEQKAAIRQLESVGIRVQTREQMRKSAGLDTLAA